jgi:hypothetical protein
MRRKIFLYLALACFAGIIAIFVFDGYLGFYDTVYVTADEYKQEIGPDFWQEQTPRHSYPYQISAQWGGTVYFSYEIANRRGQAYAATVEASLWQSNEKLAELFRQDIALSSYDKTTMEWSLSSSELEKSGREVGQYTVKIKRGDVELGEGIVLSFYSPAETGYPKSVPVPPR